MITVKYTGPDAAILAGTYIYQGETRRCSRGQLLAAQVHHPNGFEIVDGDPSPIEAEPEQSPVSSPDPNDGQPGNEPAPAPGDQPLASDDEQSTTDDPAVEEPAAEEIAPEAEIVALDEPAPAVAPAPVAAPRRAPGRR
jgi:hypothetical protein